MDFIDVIAFFKFSTTVYLYTQLRNRLVLSIFGPANSIAIVVATVSVRRPFRRVLLLADWLSGWLVVHRRAISHTYT